GAASARPIRRTSITRSINFSGSFVAISVRGSVADSRHINERAECRIPQPHIQQRGDRQIPGLLEALGDVQIGSRDFRIALLAPEFQAGCKGFYLLRTITLIVGNLI